MRSAWANPQRWWCIQASYLCWTRGLVGWGCELVGLKIGPKCIFPVVKCDWLSCFQTECGDASHVFVPIVTIRREGKKWLACYFLFYLFYKFANCIKTWQWRMLVNYYDSMGGSITPLIREKYAFIKLWQENIILELIFAAQYTFTTEKCTQVRSL